METEKSCKIGFAITGSFCTHEKIKEIIQDMVDDGMDISRFFGKRTDHRQSFWKSRSIYRTNRRNDRAYGHTFHTGCRADRTEWKFRRNGHRTLYRKYHGKTLQRHYRYAGSDGGKGTP